MLPGASGCQGAGALLLLRQEGACPPSARWGVLAQHTPRPGFSLCTAVLASWTSWKRPASPGLHDPLRLPDLSLSKADSLGSGVRPTWSLLFVAVIPRVPVTREAL